MRDRHLEWVAMRNDEKKIYEGGAGGGLLGAISRRICSACYRWRASFKKTISGRGIPGRWET